MGQARCQPLQQRCMDLLSRAVMQVRSNTSSSPLQPVSCGPRHASGSDAPALPPVCRQWRLPLHTLFTNQLRLHHHGGSLRMFSHSSKVIDGKDVCNSQAGQGRLKAAAMGCDSKGTQLQKAHAACACSVCRRPAGCRFQGPVSCLLTYQSTV